MSSDLYVSFDSWLYMKIVYVDVVNILDDATLFKFLAANGVTNNKCYTRLDPAKYKHESVLRMVSNLATSTLVAETFGFTHHAEPIAWISSEKKTRFKIKVTEGSVKIEHKTALFHVILILKRAKAFIDEVPLRRLNLCGNDYQL